MNYKQIIDLIEAKDKRGWEALYLVYGKKFYGYAIDKWHFSQDEAWEIVYQTLETIILKIGEYEIESQRHFDNLVFKILKNFLGQFYRKKKLKVEQVQIIPLAELDIFEETAKEDETGDLTNSKIPFDSNFFNEMSEAEEPENPLLLKLSEALNRLDPIEKDLVLLKAHGFSYDEIATMLNIENNQLKVKHHRAKKKLIKHLQNN